MMDLLKKIQPQGGLKNVVAGLAAALAAAAVVADQLLELNILPAIGVSIATMVVLGSGLLFGTLKDQDGDGDVDDDDRRIAAERLRAAAAQVRDSAGKSLILVFALTLGACGGQQRGDLLPTFEGGSVSWFSTLDGETSGECLQGAGCDAEGDATGTVVVSSAGELCSDGSCLGFRNTATLVVLVEADGGDTRTYGTIVNCTQSEALKVIDRATALFAPLWEPAAVIAAALDGDTFCYEARVQQ